MNKIFVVFSWAASRVRRPFCHFIFVFNLVCSCFEPKLLAFWASTEHLRACPQLEIWPINQVMKKDELWNFHFNGTGQLPQATWHILRDGRSRLSRGPLLQVSLDQRRDSTRTTFFVSSVHLRDLLIDIGLHGAGRPRGRPPGHGVWSTDAGGSWIAPRSTPGLPTPRVRPQSAASSSSSSSSSGSSSSFPEHLERKKERL